MKLFSKSRSRRPARQAAGFDRSPRRTAASTPRRVETKPEWTWLPIDKKLAFICFAFICFGLIFTYSSSAFDSTAYFRRQVLFDVLGVAAALFLSQTYRKLQEYVKPMWLMYITWILLIWVLFTPKIANVHRWINLGFFNLQPSEVAKVTLVIYMADYLGRYQGKLGRNWRLLIKPLLITAITFALIMKAPDLGTIMLMGAVVVMMLFVAGTSLKYLGVLFAAALPVVLYQLIFVSYRLERVLSFLNPEAQAGGAGYQLMQSFLAVGSGGWFGKGLGNSELKLEYLPAAHTDFIFSIMCEEIGLIGVLVIIVFFCWLLTRGISLARVARNGFHGLLIFGLTMTICAQAFFNMAMAIGLLPTKGIPLPFFSYGGSSVLMTVVMIGIIANLAAESTAPKARYTDDLTDYGKRTR